MSVTFYVEGLAATYAPHEHDEFCYPDPENCKGEYVSAGVNLANANAMDVLGRLGFDIEDLVGSADADDFLGRCMVANVGQLDDGLTEAVSTFPGGSTMVDCGRRPGYFADRMGELYDVAMQARSLGLRVVWD
jgi:hypothetical protein